MKPLLIILTALFFPRFAIGQCSQLSQLEWLTGHWQSDTGKSVISESWNRISSKSFEGKGITRSKQGEIKGQESLRLVEMESEVFYLAKVAHNALPIAFKAEECRKDFARFANPNHDFPQQLTYKLADDTLTVDVKGENDSQFSLTFTRK